MTTHKIHAGSTYSTENREQAHVTAARTDKVSEYPFIGYIVGKQGVYQWAEDGRCSDSDPAHKLVTFREPRTGQLWLNLACDVIGVWHVIGEYNSREDAERFQRNACDARVCIEVTEGQGLEPEGSE